VKILHLTTTLLGGAGVATSRLTVAQGNDSRTIVKIISSLEQDHQTELGAPQVNAAALKSKAITALQQIIAKKDIHFVSPLSASKLDWSFIQFFNPDIIHIHNWYNLLSLNDISNLLEKHKVVFTAHDERLLTGGCHITFGCRRYAQNCSKCPQVRFGGQLISRSAEKSHNFLSTSKGYSVITPSRWLTEKFELASFINPITQIKTIPNVVSLDQESSRIKSTEPSVRFLFVTASSASSNKGLSDVVRAITQLSVKKPGLKINLEIAGVKNFQLDTKTSSFNLKCLGFLSENEMREAYLRSDALIVASKSENSPNVIPEAQLHNVVVIANAVGGIPEIIQNGENGFLYGLNEKSLLSALMDFIELPEQEKIKIENRALGSAKARHNTTQILEETLSVYRELVERNK